MEEIVRYLNGKMTDGERRRFEERLASDPGLQAQLQVEEGLRQLRLQKKVEEVAAARPQWERKAKWRRFGTWALFAGLVISLAVFVWVKHEKTPPVPPAPSELPPATTPAETPPAPAPSEEVEEVAPVLPKEKKEKTAQPPIAGAQPSDGLLPPLYPSPNLRGEYSENKELKLLLDKIWYTEYPPQGMVPGAQFSEVDGLLSERDFNKAYVRLQRLERNLPDNDTLHLLKAYCLMQMGEGAGALTYFDKLKDRPTPWQPSLQWYRGLCLLMAGEREKAVAAFQLLANDPKHLYQKHGEQAVRALK